MKIRKSILCLILAALMLLPQTAMAFAVDNEETIIPFSDEFVYDETSIDPGDTGEVENEPEDLPDLADLEVEADPNEFLANTESIAGASVVTVAEPQQPVEDGDLPEDAVELQVDAPQVIENPQTESEEIDAVDDEGSNESGALFARVKVSSSILSMNAGEIKDVTVSYGGWFLGKITMRYTVYDKTGNESKGVVAEWGGWNRKKAALHVNGLEAGDYIMKVEMYSTSKNRVLASSNIMVTVKPTDVKITCSPSSLSMAVNKPASTVVSITGTTSSMKKYYDVGDKSICSVTDASLKSFTVKGLKKGSTYIEFYVRYENSSTKIASKTITVTVEDGRVVELSKSSDTVNIGSSGTATITTYATGTLSVSSSNTSVCTASISGTTLSYKGLKAGTATLTVYLKSGSTTLGSASMTVTVAPPKPVITCDKSSISVALNGTATLKYTVTGWPENTAIVWGSSSSVTHTTTKWADAWDGYTLALTVKGVSAGTDTYVIQLVRKVNGTVQEVYSSVTVKVTVTDDILKITPSVSSVNLPNSSATQTVRLTVSGASSWTVSSSVSGGTCSVKMTASSTYVDAVFSYVKAGTSTVTFTVKDKNNTSRTVTCIVTVECKKDGPIITLTPNTYTINAGETVGIGVAGFQAAVVAKASGLTNGTSYQWGVSCDNSYISAEPISGADLIYLRGLKTGTTTVYVGVVKSGSNTFTSYSSLTLKIVSANAKNFSDYNFSFNNFSTTIPLSTYQIVFPSAIASSMYKAHGNGQAGGLCYGMACASMLFNDSRSGVTTSQFKSSASKVSALSKTDKSSTYGMTVSTFIQVMYLTQYEVNSAIQDQVTSYDVAGIMDTLSKGTPVNLGFYMYEGSAYKGGHAIVAYAVDSSKTTITAYDNNYPDKPITIKYAKSNGQYSDTNVTFPYTGYKGANNYRFTYVDMPQILYCWSNRGKLYNKGSINQNYNFFYTNSDSFNVYDEHYNLVATYNENGLAAYDSGIVEILPKIIDDSIELPYNQFYFPTDTYTVENCDETVDTFTASMTNFERTAEVNTDADAIELNVDDTEDLCEATVSLDKAENYNIKLLSYVDGEESKYISGSASSDDASVAVTMDDGEWSDVVKGATIAVNGGDEYGVYVEATAGEGGSITPAGVNRVSNGQDLHFDITPDEGYEIADVYVNGVSVGAVESYDYLDAAEDAAIYATFKKAEKLDVLVEPNRKTYNLGDTFDPAGMQLRIMYNDGSAKIVTDDFTYDTRAFTTPGKNTVNLSYEGLTTSYTVNTTNLSISIKTPSKTTIRYGDTLMLHAEVTPADAKVIWSSSDPTIATASADGGVTCLKTGTVTITATIVDGDSDPGNDASASITLNCKGGLFWKIISYIKNLFKISRIISAAINAIQ